jgi:hypothetical protein
MAAYSPAFGYAGSGRDPSAAEGSWGASVVLALEDQGDLLLQLGKVMLHHLPDAVEVNAEVVVDEHVAEPDYAALLLTSRWGSSAGAVRRWAATGFVCEPKLIEQASRFELDPSAEQAVFLGVCCGAARFWFNRRLRSGRSYLCAAVDRERAADGGSRSPCSSSGAGSSPFGQTTVRASSSTRACLK